MASPVTVRARLHGVCLASGVRTRTSARASASPPSASVRRAGRLDHQVQGCFRVEDHREQRGPHQRLVEEGLAEDVADAGVVDRLADGAAHQGGGAHGVGEPETLSISAICRNPSVSRPTGVAYASSRVTSPLAMDFEPSLS